MGIRNLLHAGAAISGNEFLHSSTGERRPEPAGTTGQIQHRFRKPGIGKTAIEHLLLTGGGEPGSQALPVMLSISASPRAFINVGIAQRRGPSITVVAAGFYHFRFLSL